MKLTKIFGFSLLSIAAFFSACEDNTTTIGSSIAAGEVIITTDSVTYALNAKPVYLDVFDSKTGNLMLGSLQVENYGRLDCSFVTRLLPAANLNIADSIFNLKDFTQRVDSCKLIMGANRSAIVGDSLAPQKLTLFKLTKQLPSDIDNKFNPYGYYNPDDPFASKSYTVSGIAQKDSAFYNSSFVELNVDLPREFGMEIFQTYKDSPEIFQWPQTMAKDFLPGFYMQQTFGNGCVANINTVYVGVFYHTFAEVTEVVDEETVTSIVPVTNLSIPFTVSPEVLSSNNISYKPSENIVSKNEMNENSGEIVVTTPGGYIAQFEFPAQDFIDLYNSKNAHLTTVNDLVLYIPGETFDETEDIGLAQNILLIKKSEYEDFFSKNKVPDNMSAFIGAYNSNNGLYHFTSMRNYFIDLLGKTEITEDDITFYLVPVDVTTESSDSYYASNTYVTKCVPLTSKPTMTLLKTNESIIAFSFSTQLID